MSIGVNRMSGKDEQQLVKKIFSKMIIEGCDDCPYCQFEYYDCSPSRYNCKHPDVKYPNGWIIDEWDWDNPRNKKRLILKHKKMPIPDWCPFSGIEERKEQ